MIIAGYDLHSPVINDCDGHCCTVTFSAGITTRTYRLCWRSGKLAQVVYVG